MSEDPVKPAVAKVVSLRPDVPINGLKYEDPNVIEILETALEEAHSGTLVGVAIAKVYHDMQTHQNRSGVMTWSMVGRLQGMVDGVIRDLKEA